MPVSLSGRGVRGVVAAAVAVVVALVLGGVTWMRYDDGSAAPSSSGGSPAPSYDAPSPPELRDPHPCPGPDGFTCSSLRVPVDHRSPGGGHLDLQVAVSDHASAPRGVLLMLSGGPGQPGVALLPRVAPRLAPLLGDYRLVAIDQRGTGANALQCPVLQEQLGASDLFVPTRKAVEDCAAAIGPDRRFYGTADTVADLDLLRRALRVARWTLDGISYGTFTAAHYAIAHPGQVARMVLDSVVPHTGVDAFLQVPQRATARVLRDVCQERSCPGDPAADLHTAVAGRRDGSDVLNAITIDGILSPGYRGVPEVLHAAATGDRSSLDLLVHGIREGVQTRPEELSQGLHAATLCADGVWPWAADDDAGARAAAVRRAGAAVSAGDVYPYDRLTAMRNGILLTCQWWPSAKVRPLPRPRLLPSVPTLLLGGGRDLSTPVEWLRQQEAMTPDATVLIVDDASHSLQTRSGERVMATVTGFLTQG
jgi:pimeloyl-ACP methyl ester carboxylesterase